MTAPDAAAIRRAALMEAVKIMEGLSHGYDALIRNGRSQQVIDIATAYKEVADLGAHYIRALADHTGEVNDG